MRIMVGKLTGTCGSGILNFSQVVFRSRRKRENDREREREKKRSIIVHFLRHLLNFLVNHSLCEL